MPNIGDNSVFTLRDDVVACELDEGKALLDMRESKYYKLNGSAALIWGWIGSGSSFDQLLDNMLERFDVSEEQCRKDLQAVLSDFLNTGLIEQTGGKSS